MIVLADRRTLALPSRLAPFVMSLLTTGLSMAATGIVAMAVSWHLISGGAGTTAAGIAAFAIQLPVVLGLLIGGRLADTLGPWKVLMVSNLGAGLATISAVVLAIWDPQAWQPVVTLVALASFLGAPGTVAQDARVPELARIAGLRLERATGLRDLSNMLGQVGAPALGVALVHLFGLAITLAVVAGLLILVAIIDALFFPRFHTKLDQSTKPATPWSVIRADPFLLTVIVIGVTLVAVFTSLDEILAPALAVAADLGATRLSAFLLLSGVSALTTAGLFAWRGHVLNHRVVFAGGIACAAAGFIILAIARPDIAFWIAPLLIGGGIGPLSPIIITCIHRRVPARSRGSVHGLLMSLILAGQPIAALSAGPAIDRFGLRAVIVALAVLVSAMAVASALLPSLSILGRLPNGASEKRPAS